MILLDKCLPIQCTKGIQFVQDGYLYIVDW